MEDNSWEKDWHSFDFLCRLFVNLWWVRKKSFHQGWNFFNNVFRNSGMHLYIYMKLLKTKHWHLVAENTKKVFYKLKLVFLEQCSRL